MIDQNLINHNSISLAGALKNGSAISPQVKFIKDAFNQDLLLKLQEYFTSNFHSGPWKPETNEYGIPKKNTPRYKLEWDPESVIEEIYEVCNSVTSLLQELYTCPNLAFDGITIWRDHPGYNIDWHTDNPIIHLTMQIYLFGSPACPGTEFKTDSGSITAPFVPNNGYFVDQHITRPTHRTAHAVLENQMRYSLFAIWKNIS
jgi:hypothetical protein